MYVGKHAAHRSRRRPTITQAVLTVATATALATAIPPTAAMAEEGDAAAAGACYAAGSYGFDTGLIESITPVLVDYSLISYVTTYNCTAAQITVTAVPAVGTPTQCTLHYPDPAIGNSSGCANLLGAGGVLQYGTPVQLTARFVGVDASGGTTSTTRACTRNAAYSMPPAVLPYYPGAGPRCSF